MNMKSFWEQEEIVEQFASRKPDHRMVALLEHHAEPAGYRVLDIGCAGGRNTEWLAERRFGVQAVDPSEPMVLRTRRRLTGILGVNEATALVRVGLMQDLSAFSADSFDLVIALGVYHNAQGREDWKQTIEETVRVLKVGGTVLLSNFSPRSQPRGTPLEPIPGEPGLYMGFSSGALYLLEAPELDGALARHGLAPSTPTESVQVATDTGYRISVNGLYVKRAV